MYVVAIALRLWPGRAGLQQVKSARRKRAGLGVAWELFKPMLHLSSTYIDPARAAGCCRSSSGSSHHAHGLMDACGRRAARGAGQQHGSGRPPMAMHACAYSSAHTVVIYHAPPRTGRPASSVAGGGRRRAEDDDKRKPPRRTYSRLVAIGCRCRPAREITHSAWTHAVNRHAAAVVLQLASSLRFFCFAWLVG